TGRRVSTPVTMKSVVRDKAAKTPRATNPEPEIPMRTGWPRSAIRRPRHGLRIQTRLFLSGGSGTCLARRTRRGIDISGRGHDDLDLGEGNGKAAVVVPAGAHLLDQLVAIVPGSHEEIVGAC